VPSLSSYTERITTNDCGCRLLRSCGLLIPETLERRFPCAGVNGEALTIANHAIWVIAALSILGVIGRPWKLPEAIWAVSGAVMLVERCAESGR
jgi:hypothetical protein